MINKRICVIGAGNWGKNHVQTLHGLGALAGVVETDQGNKSKIELNYPDIKIFNNISIIKNKNFICIFYGDN